MRGAGQTRSGHGRRFAVEDLARVCEGLRGGGKRRGSREGEVFDGDFGPNGRGLGAGDWLAIHQACLEKRGKAIIGDARTFGQLSDRRQRRDDSPRRGGEGRRGGQGPLAQQHHTVL